MTDNIIREVVGGNGNQFQTKEILQAHIIDDNAFKKEIRDEFKWVRTRFEKGTGKISAFGSSVKSISNVLKYGVGPIIFLMLGWLLKLQIKP